MRSTLGHTSPGGRRWHIIASVVPSVEQQPVAGAVQIDTPSQAALRRFRRNRLGTTGLALSLLIVLVALLAPVLATHNPNTQFSDGLSAMGGPLPPSPSFWFGTDNLGRDLYSRILFGTRTSMFVAITANVISLVIALIFGTVAGYAGGVVDTILMRITDILISFPVLLLAGFLAVVLRPGVTVVVVVIGFSSWFYLARIVRAEVLSVKHREYIEAARALGAPSGRIVRRHVLPQILGQALVYGTLNFSTTVLFAAALSYLGIGVQPPTPDWGNMIAEGAQYLTVMPWLVVFPGIFLGISVLGFNLVGDGLRDALDPKNTGGR
jgi:ABC-type dipeptide/oligopeptide/nickel transport system permease subunit